MFFSFQHSTRQHPCRSLYIHTLAYLIHSRRGDKELPLLRTKWTHRPELILDKEGKNIYYKGREKNPGTKIRMKGNNNNSNNSII